MRIAQFGLDEQEKCHQFAQSASVLHSYEYSSSEAKFPHADVAYPLLSHLTAVLPTSLQNILQPSKTVIYIAALFHAALTTCGTKQFTYH
jgi:hypothetical protein